MSLVTEIQKIFRLKQFVKKAKNKFLAYTNKGEKPILFKCIREFYE